MFFIASMILIFRRRRAILTNGLSELSPLLVESRFQRYLCRRDRWFGDFKIDYQLCTVKVKICQFCLRMDPGRSFVRTVLFGLEKNGRLRTLTGGHRTTLTSFSSSAFTRRSSRSDSVLPEILSRYARISSIEEPYFFFRLSIRLSREMALSSSSGVKVICLRISRRCRKTDDNISGKFFRRSCRFFAYSLTDCRA